MNKIELKHLGEPKLTFGYNQKTIDVRDGLTMFGPESDVISTNLGIIGTKDSQKRILNWLNKIKRPVFVPKNDIARPFFPGLESTFGLKVNLDNIVKLNVDSKQIEYYLNYYDSNQRVHNLVNLFADKLIRYSKEEEFHVNVWIVAVSDEIFQYCRPKSVIPMTNNTIKAGLKKKNRAHPKLFDTERKLQEAYNYKPHFHNQLKAKLLEHKIITQIIRESTLGYEEIFTNEQKIESERKFDSAKAWNIATTLYYKAGGIPWKLGEIRDKVCYIGLVYKKIDSNSNSRNAACAAQMFLESGDGQVFRGNIGPWYNPRKGEFHLKKKDAFELLRQSLSAFENKNGFLPKQIFLHARTFFNDEEWDGFTEAVNGKIKLIGVRIRDDNVFKLYREKKYAVPRGTMFSISVNKAFLWTKGYIPRIQSQLGVETPNPLSIEITRGEEDIEIVCKDILALTKLNYNACIFADGLPVTLRFANKIGDILTAGPIEKSEVLPFKYYI